MGKGLKLSAAVTSVLAAKSGPCWLRKLIVVITHSAASEVKIYNNTAASGTAILDLKWDLAPTASDTKNVDFPGAGIYLNTGIYVTVHGGTEGAYVAWDE